MEKEKQGITASTSSKSQFSVNVDTLKKDIAIILEDWTIPTVQTLWNKCARFLSFCGMIVCPTHSWS